MSENQKSFRTAEVAKMVRRKLAEQFPSVKFSVRSSQFAGGSSIDVKWTDGPTTKAVDAIVMPYKSTGFDGSIDMTYGLWDKWLMPDGYSIVMASSEGTRGSGGYTEGFETPKPHPQAERVTFHSGYMSTARNYSLATLQTILNQLKAEQPNNTELQAIQATANQYGTPELTNETNTAHSVRLYDEWLDTIIHRRFGELDLTPKPAPKDTTAPQTVDNVTVRHNEQLNGIEVIFPSKPDQNIIETLKAKGFRWSFKQGLWYTRYNESLMQWAQGMNP